jgi:protein ImuA
MAATTPCASVSAEQPPARLERLRRTLCVTAPSLRVTATGAGSGWRLVSDGGAVLALGIPAIDDILGGGLSCGALHEIAAAGETVTVAATGFALALAARMSRCARDASMPVRCAAQGQALSQPTGGGVLWIAEDLSLAENGAPYGPGLDQAGIAPEQLITVATAHRRDALWAMEEALRCPAIAVAIGELRGRSIDQVATRRLSLAAAAGHTLGLILRTAPDDEPSAAATRWIIGPAPPSPLSRDRWGVGPPRLAIELMRNRRGHLGAWIVEWNSVEQRFELATHSEPVAGAASDRPHRAAVA